MSNFDNSNISVPQVYTVPSSSCHIITPSNPLCPNEILPDSYQSGLCFDPTHHHQNLCHTILLSDSSYVIRTLPYDHVFAQEDAEQQRRRRFGIAFCICFCIFFFSLPPQVFF